MNILFIQSAHCSAIFHNRILNNMLHKVAQWQFYMRLTTKETSAHTIRNECSRQLIRERVLMETKWQ